MTLTIAPVLPETGGVRHPLAELTPVHIPTGALDDVLDALLDRRIFVQDERRLALLDLAIEHVGAIVACRALNPAYSGSREARFRYGHAGFGPISPLSTSLWPSHAAALNPPPRNA